MAHTSNSATLYVDARCILGEGLIWSPRREAWLWTDIEGRRLWSHHPGTGLTRSWRVPDRLGAFAVARSGRLLLGFAKALAWADLDSAPEGELPVTMLTGVQVGQPATRINDGRADRNGNFVFGTYNEGADAAPTGHFFQFSVRHGLRPLGLAGVTIANSICFSPDGRTMYFCDSPARCIMRCDYDAARAATGNVAEFVRLRETDAGIPDGSVVDSEGGLWNAGWGSGLLRRYLPDGRLSETVPVPARHVTCPAFGGPALDELCVTSARWLLEPQQLADVPESGGVYRVGRTSVGGLADIEVDD